MAVDVGDEEEGLLGARHAPVEDGKEPWAQVGEEALGDLRPVQAGGRPGVGGHTSRARTVGGAGRRRGLVAHGRAASSTESASSGRQTSRSGSQGSGRS